MEAEKRGDREVDVAEVKLRERVAECANRRQ